MAEIIAIASDLFTESGEDGLDLDWCNTSLISETYAWLKQMVSVQEAQG